MERGLLGLAHPLNDARQRVQFRPQQGDDKVVVMLVQPVTGQPNIIAQANPAKGATDTAMFHQDDILFLWRKLFKGAGAAQGIPDHPRHGWINNAASRAGNECIIKILLIAQGIGAAQHGMFGLGGQLVKGRLVIEAAHVRQEVVG